MMKSRPQNVVFLLTACIVNLSVAVPSAVAQVDTDGDRLRDVLDTPGFDADASGELELRRRGIQDLDGVHELKSIHTLDLGSNQITRIESGDFAGLSSLQILDISGNQITGIERGDFDGLTNLQTLRLGYNEISIEPGAFSGLTSLQWISLPVNRITSVESGDFDGFTNLHTLQLPHNLITSIEHGDFNGLTNLEILDLEGNQITSIESGSFKGMANLHTLLVRGSNFTGATFAALEVCDLSDRTNRGSRKGFCNGEATHLILDDATVSIRSFGAIMSDSFSSVTHTSLVGLSFSDSNPARLRDFLNMQKLDKLTVDQEMFNLYADELNAFAAEDDKTLTVVPLGDCSKDGILTSEDVSCIYATRSRDPLLAALNTLPGDLDGNGKIDFVDFLVVSNNFGTHLPTYADGNINLEGRVDFADFLILSENFAFASKVTSVPEPNCGLLLLSAVIGFMCLRNQPDACL